jgi:plastocyanin
MSRIPVLLAVLALLAVTACSQQEPSIALEEQVPADQRDDAASDNGNGEPAPDADGNGEAAPDADVAETVQFEAGDLFFEGIPGSLPAGTIEFQMDNVGNLPHDLYVDELGNQEIVPLTQGGESASGTVDFEPGEYTLYCDVPGHRSAGMEETVSVE